MNSTPSASALSASPPKPPTLAGRAAARAAWAFASFVAATTRWSYEDSSGLSLREGHQQVIFAVWHNRQLIAPAVYQRLYLRTTNRRLASIASASSDGAIAARVLELSGAAAVRGSSSRRGARALAELIELAGKGFDLAVTPDGPRGPRYTVKPGVIVLAQRTGLPVVPLSYFLSRKKVLKSWDGFQIPLPGGRAEVRAAAALWVPSKLEEAERGRLAIELQERLRAITHD
ncbi:MAG TPA: lysophospholipid acyltransferase family protein [Verrucomicrobiota bacterium]|nr:hypothetical protein [Verrucomicrobiales bacterium]HRI12222.1 lysophospholipid acyltransferase family protein [Verrucomicrobiota bacterium]